MLILLLQLKMQALRNMVSSLRGTEVFALVIGIAVLAYSLMFAMAIVDGVATLLADRSGEVLKQAVLSFYVVLSVLPVLLGSFLGGRFRTVMRLEQLAFLPASRRDVFLFFTVSEILDPFVLSSCALAGTLMVWLIEVSWVSLVFSALLLVLFGALIVLTKVVYESTLDFVGSYRLLPGFLWFMITVIGILVCMYALRLALEAVASGQAAPETRVWWLWALPPGIVASAILSVRSGNVPLVHIVGLTAIVMSGLRGWWYVHWARGLRLRRGSSFPSLQWVRAAKERLLAPFHEHLHPLVIKDILYYVRCNRSQLAFLAGAGVYVMMGLSSARADQLPSNAWHLYAVVMGAMSSVGMAGNSFAFEGTGIVSYGMLPVSGDTVLRTKLVSFRIVMALECGLICMVALLWSPRGASAFLPLLPIAVVVVDLSLTAGLHLSCFFPMKARFQGIVGQAIPAYSVVLWIGFTSLLMLPAFFLGGKWCLADWPRILGGSLIAAAGIWLFRRWMMKMATLQFARNWERIFFVIR